MIILGADHRGFKLKEAIIKYLRKKGVKTQDCGAFSKESADYPDYAYKAAKLVAGSRGKHKGIVICGSGVGASIVANKVKGAYCPLVIDKTTARQSIEHGNVNMIALAVNNLTPAKAKAIVSEWLKAKFTGKARYNRRLDKIKEYERIEFR